MNTSTEDSSIPRRSVVLAVLLLASGLIIGVLSSELLLRTFWPQPIIPRFVESAPWGIRRVLGHVDAIHKTTEYAYSYHTNSQGFRGVQEYSFQPPKGVLRIVVQGDSVTLGHGVADDQTFSFLLDRKLSDRGINVEVINMAVSGFGTAEELIQFQEVGIRYSPHLVILGYFQNDDDNNHVSQLYEVKNGELRRQSGSFQPGIFIRDRVSRVPFYDFLSQHSHLVTMFRNSFSSLIWRKLAAEQSEKLPARRHGDSVEASELTRLLLNAYIKRITDSGAELIIVDIVNDRFDSDLPEMLRLNQHSRVIKVGDALARARGIGMNLFYDVDGHPTAEGHEVIAEVLGRTIVQEALWAD